jgi:PPOX class probable F420-dependent enzyme
MPDVLNENSLKILKGKNFGFFATLNRDGSPQLTPVWIDTDGENVFVNTAIGRVKEKNVRRDPRVSISVANWKNPYSFITVNGVVEKKVTGKVAEDHIDKMAKKYAGVEKYSNRKPGERRILFTIKPKRIIQR